MVGRCALGEKLWLRRTSQRYLIGRIQHGPDSKAQLSLVHVASAASIQRDLGRHPQNASLPSERDLISPVLWCAGDVISEVRGWPRTQRMEHESRTAPLWPPWAMHPKNFQSLGSAPGESGTKERCCRQTRVASPPLPRRLLWCPLSAQVTSGEGQKKETALVLPSLHLGVWASAELERLRRNYESNLHLK